MLDVVLYEPEIPPNTGNVIRLCANTGCRLHLIRPLGFDMDDTRLRRAGLDYREYASVSIHDHLDAFTEAVRPRRLLALSTRGRRRYDQAGFSSADAVLFGPETRGLPQAVLDRLDSDHILRLPMLAHSRSLNLGNSVSVVIYEAWRQMGFEGGA